VSQGYGPALMLARSWVPGTRARPLTILPLTAGILLLAWYVGRNPSIIYVVAPLAVAVSLALLRRPWLGLPALIVLALAVHVSIGTGTEVQLNLAALAVPALFGLWLLGAALRGHIAMPPSPVNPPLFLFLLAGLLSLGIGIGTWDPLIPRRPSFIVVQLAQWAIFAFSAIAFWLTAILVRDARWLQRMVVTFVLIGGLLALLRVFPPLQPVFSQVTTGAVDRAPFWLLLSALSGGQLLFNRRLRLWQSGFLTATLVLSLYYAFFLEREGASTWGGVAVALIVLVWLRFRRLRTPMVATILALGVLGLLFPVLWDFAGGDEEWVISGGSRYTLIERVVTVTMRNPITGLGPAAYRLYANAEPLLYGRAFWVAPEVNSHNNYVDLFAHGGLVGLALFGWFAVEYALLGVRLLRRYRDGFAGAYVASMLAAGAASLVIMLLADWMLPFVYNIGFNGFQASVLVWLFLGGLVALDNAAPAAECR